MPYPAFTHPHTLSTAPILSEKTSWNLAIARFPGGNSEHPASSDWIASTLLQATADASVGTITRLRYSGTPVTVSRNTAVLDAISAGADYLLMIDSDMAPDIEPDGLPFWDTAWRFMKNRRNRENESMLGYGPGDSPSEVFDFWWSKFAPAAIGAPYCGPSPTQPVYTMKFKERCGSGHPDVHPQLTQFGRREAAMRTGVEKVASLATGLVLIDLRMFFYLPTPWFAYEYTDAYQSQVATTEDVFWGRNATYLGMPSYVAWDCWAGHWKLELVKKPRPVTLDNISDDITAAIRLNLDSRNKLHFQNRDA